MSIVIKARIARSDPGTFHYQHDRPEKTLLYQLVSTHYPVFRQQLAEEGRTLPDCVQREFEDYLKCGWLEHGFIRALCESCHEEHLVAFSCKRRGFCSSSGARRMAESSALLVADDIAAGELVRLSDQVYEYRDRYYFVSPTDSRPNAALDNFRDWLIEISNAQRND